jgi:hypothetical protein
MILSVANRFERFAFLAAAMLASGCAMDTDTLTGEGEPAEEVGESQDGIINGTPVNNPENSGMVWLEEPSGCSGTLLTNDWILTASHCGVMLVQPDQIKVNMGNIGSPALQKRTGVFRVNHPSVDFALVRVNRPFVMNGSTTGYRMGLYEGSTASLFGKQLTGYGYSDDFCDQNGCSGWGFLRSMQVQAVAAGVDEYNYWWFSVPGDQAIVYGDSGGGGFRDTPAGRFLAGVAKNGGMYQLPENCRDWVTSYIYDRPIALPQAWWVWDAIKPFSNGVRLGPGPFPGEYEDYQPGNPKMWDKPLAHDYDVKGRWQDPCPGGTYTWKASHQIENGWDWIDVATSDPDQPNQLKVTRLTGSASTAVITGRGDLWVDVHTDGSVVSQGITSMSFECNRGIEFSIPWESPLANNLNGSAPPWDPCPGGQAFTWTAAYDFLAGDQGIISYTPNPEFPQPVETVLAGVGTLQGTSYGPTDVRVITNGAGQSVGIKSLTAECSMAIDCHGARCFTLPELLPDSGVVGGKKTVGRWWNPCNGGSFTWTAKHQLETNFDFGKVGNTSFTGWNGVASGAASGQVWVQVSVDHSIRSGGFDLSAVCAAWAANP